MNGSRTLGGLDVGCRIVIFVTLMQRPAATGEPVWRSRMLTPPAFRKEGMLRVASPRLIDLMEVLRKRTRLVYFRVSELELQKLRELCFRSGAGSLSELARSAMQRMLDEHPTETGTADLQALYQRVEALDAKLQELIRYLHERQPLLHPEQIEQIEKERRSAAAE